MKTHVLKTWPEPFEAVSVGKKTHEVRRDDRGYQVGDRLRLREWDPCAAGNIGAFTERECTVLVKYITPGGRWGLPVDVVVMSVELALFERVTSSSFGPAVAAALNGGQPHIDADLIDQAQGQDLPDEQMQAPCRACADRTCHTIRTLKRQRDAMRGEAPTHDWLKEREELRARAIQSEVRLQAESRILADLRKELGAMAKRWCP